MFDLSQSAKIVAISAFLGVKFSLKVLLVVKNDIFLCCADVGVEENHY